LLVLSLNEMELAEAIANTLAERLHSFGNHSIQEGASNSNNIVVTSFYRMQSNGSKPDHVWSTQP
jgi:hypothetical protein